jgi:hypothetical protein
LPATQLWDGRADPTEAACLRGATMNASSPGRCYRTTAHCSISLRRTDASTPPRWTACAVDPPPLSPHHASRPGAPLRPGSGPGRATRRRASCRAGMHACRKGQPVVPCANSHRVVSPRPSRAVARAAKIARPQLAVAPVVPLSFSMAATAT